MTDSHHDHDNGGTVEKTHDAGPSAGINLMRRVDKTFRMRVIQLLIKPFRPRLATSSKQKSTDGSMRLTPHSKSKKRCGVSERQVCDIWLYDLSRSPSTSTTTASKTSEAKRSRRIYYFGGGGWQQPPSDGHWKFVAEMAHRLPDTTITVVSYPLAPSCPASISMPLLRTLYDALMEESASRDEQVVFMGDSSGGNIVLSLVTWALQDPASLAPSAVMGICPTVDLRHWDKNILEVAKRDPIFTADSIQGTAAAWVGDSKDSGGEWGLGDPRVSPALASLEPLRARGVQVHGMVGTWDVLSVEAMAFRERCAREGLTGEWLEWEGQMHCFPLVYPYGLKESEEALEWIVRTVRKT